MERVYKRNIFYQQKSYKLNHVRDVIRNREGGTFLWALLGAVYLLDTLLGVIIISSLVSVRWEGLIGEYITTYVLGMLHYTKQLLQWLMVVPAGLKLNNPLTEFLADKFINLLKLWELFYVSLIHYYLKSILSVVLSMKYFGLTIVLAIIFDFLKFLNIWLICFYIFSSRILWFQLSVSRSLFRLFMGHKWNPLRNRVDSCKYDTNQLLLGTLFFTIVLFLLPTTAMFFIIFFGLRIIQFSLQMIIRFIIVFVNKLTSSVSNRICSIYTNPSISTLHFKITENVNLETGTSIVTGLWNGYELTLHEISELCNKDYDDIKNELNLTKEHTMNKWIDTNPF